MVTDDTLSEENMPTTVEKLSKTYSESTDSVPHDELMRLSEEAQWAWITQDLIHQATALNQILALEIRRLEGWMSVNYDFTEEGSSLAQSARGVLRACFRVGELVAWCRSVGHEINGAEILDDLVPTSRELFTLASAVQEPFKTRAKALKAIADFDCEKFAAEAEQYRPPQSWYEEKFVRPTPTIPAL